MDFKAVPGGIVHYFKVHELPAHVGEQVKKLLPQASEILKTDIARARKAGNFVWSAGVLKHLQELGGTRIQMRGDRLEAPALRHVVDDARFELERILQGHPEQTYFFHQTNNRPGTKATVRRLLSLALGVHNRLPRELKLEKT